MREDAAPSSIAYTRKRGMVVVLGALVSLGIAVVDARFSQAGLITIPLWQALLRQHTTRLLIRTGVLAA